jgi:hypothetical protein
LASEGSSRDRIDPDGSEEVVMDLADEVMADVEEVLGGRETAIRYSFMSEQVAGILGEHALGLPENDPARHALRLVLARYMEAPRIPAVMQRAFALVAAERQRQEGMKHSGRFKYTAADKRCPTAHWLSALGEEYGEVCKEISDTIQEPPGDQDEMHDHEERLRAELVQVAAVAVARVEALS